MQIKTPRLFRNRFGVFYFRIKTVSLDRRFSLRTKCPQTAAIIALQLNAEIERKRAMSNPKLTDFDFDPVLIRQYEIMLKNGTSIRTDGTIQDHQRAMEMLEQVERIGMIEPEYRPPRPAKLPKSEPITSAVDKWLANCKGKNGTRTVDSKCYHIKDFLARSFSEVESVERWLAENQKTVYLKDKGLRALNAKKAAGEYKNSDIEVNAITKQMLVEYKNHLLKVPQTAKTIDNKLNSLHDFFKYLLGHALLTALETNPVDGMFIQTKQARQKTTKSYQPFTQDAIKVFFDPKYYLKAMDAPDLFWAPLLGIYTGMRISEATQIRCIDIHHAASNDVHYIHVYKSKTPGGIRNVPIPKSLLDLGFLDYVAECKAAGASRIFPHRALINHSYSKELSAAMLAYQRQRNIKAAQTSFHSFRVNVVTELHNKDSNAAKVMKIVGHDEGGSHSVHWGYVRDLPECKETLDRLQWPIELESLKYDGRFKKFISDQKNWAANQKCS